MNKLILAISSFLLISCGSSSKMTTSNAESANEMESQVITFEQLSLQLLSIKAGDNLEKTGNITITLYVDVPGESYSGKSGCNNYFGSLQKQGEDQLIFQPGGRTEMMCLENIMAWETKYNDALLGKAFTVYETETNAIFSEVDGNTVLSFKKVAILQE